MNSSLANKWANALSSNDYKQGKGYLHEEVNGEHYYCCLGVLCDLYIKDLNLEGKKIEDLRESTGYSSANQMPNQEVKDWVGLTGMQASTLAGLNDSGVSFDNIASVVRMLGYNPS